MHDLFKEIDKELQLLNQVETRAKEQLSQLTQPSCLRKLMAQAASAKSSDGEDASPAAQLNASIRVSRTRGTWQLYLVTDTNRSNGQYLKRR